MSTGGTGTAAAVALELRQQTRKAAANLAALYLAAGRVAAGVPVKGATSAAAVAAAVGDAVAAVEAEAAVLGAHLITSAQRAAATAATATGVAAYTRAMGPGGTAPPVPAFAEESALEALPVVTPGADTAAVFATAAVAAATVAATMTAGAWRDASAETATANRALSWVWVAGSACCEMCAVLDGHEFPASEPMSSHPNCACVQEWRYRTFQHMDGSGLTSPADMTDEELTALIGPGKFQAYRAGALTLDTAADTGIVGWRDVPGVGRVPYTRSLRSLRPIIPR